MGKRLIVGLLAATLTACGPGAVEDLSEVEAVRVDGDRAEIAATIHMFSEHRYGTQAGTLVEDAAKLMREDETFQNVQSVTFNFSALTTDELGNEGSRRTFSATFPMGKLRAAKFENLYGADVLNLASEATPADAAGAMLIVRHCQENPGTFCERVK